MRAVVQRISRASVSVDGKAISSIRRGLLILLGVESADTMEDVEWLTGKISQMRIFGDESGKMNLDVNAAGGQAIVVSQFTLQASTKKGNRPSFIRAAAPEHANELYEAFKKSLNEKMEGGVFAGKFGAMMDVELVNEGPVTILIDSKNRE